MSDYINIPGYQIPNTGGGNTPQQQSRTLLANKARNEDALYTPTSAIPSDESLQKRVFDARESGKPIQRGAVLNILV